MNILAQTSVEIPTAPSGGAGGIRLPAFLQDIPVLIGIALGLAVILLLWATFVRRRSRRHADLRVASHVLVEAGADDSSEHRHHHHHHRRRRREHRPRNPTLAETGGLPPPRQTDELPPSL